jgi:hypothetical protein
MKKTIINYVIIAALLTLTGCSADKKMYKNLDASGYISLIYHTGMPSLGPCGFSRNMNSYDIKTPRTKGIIQCDELIITEYPDVKGTYTGYIEFKKENVIDIELCRSLNSVKTKLKINGIHKIKVEQNTIGGKAI